MAAAVVSVAGRGPLRKHAESGSVRQRGCRKPPETASTKPGTPLLLLRRRPHEIGVPGKIFQVPQLRQQRTFCQGVPQNGSAHAKKVRVSAVKPDTGDTFVGAIDTERKARYAQVVINTVRIFAKVDSRAEVFVVPSTFPGLATHLDKADKVLLGAAGHKLNVLGKLAAEIVWKKKTVSQICYVVSPLRDVLFGLPALEALGVLKFANSLTAGKERYEVLFPQADYSLGTVRREYKIRLQPGAIPHAISVPRRVPIPLMRKLKQEIERLVHRA